MFMRSLSLVVVISIILISCSRMSEDELYQKAETAYGEKNFNEAAQLFEELVNRFPDGKYAEEAMFLLASHYGDNTGDYQKGIATYHRLREKFPNGEKAAAALFLIGFVYNNHLHNYDSARTAYEQFLNTYPTHEMAPSAKFELDNLGKSPDELFRKEVAEKEQPKQKTGSKTKSAHSDAHSKKK